MKKLINSILLPLVFILLESCSSGEDKIGISLNNPNDFERTDEYIRISLDELRSKFSFVKNYLAVLDAEKEIPSQLESNDGKQYISFVTSLAPKEKKTIYIIKRNNESGKKYQSRAYAEVSMKVDYKLINGKYTGGKFQNFDSLKVPLNHTDHDALFRYEGPGWESDKVGYRYYIDWRSRIDIFGKKTHDLVLKNVGINDIYAKDDSYHNMLNWGMDIFKVGNTLGIGSYGMMVGDSIYMVSKRDSVVCKISANGPVKSAITTYFYGWQIENKKYNLQSDLSIIAGSRLTKSELTVSDNPENLITGFTKDVNCKFFEKKGDRTWSYFALYGKQSLANDNLGIALFYNNNEKTGFKEINDSYAVLLKPDSGKIIYYFCAAWEKEPEGIKTKEEFSSYLDMTLQKLDNPIVIQF
ncbi:MAG TPA: DUF4861 domain-containing protein [Ignavibacteriaceae bacterium]|nr:DUF4861 domain-containing protein [Ignavibacteriaceae bacterium]